MGPTRVNQPRAQRTPRTIASAVKRVTCCVRVSALGNAKAAQPTASSARTIRRRQACLLLERAKVRRVRTRIDCARDTMDPFGNEGLVRVDRVYVLATTETTRGLTAHEKFGAADFYGLIVAEGAAV